MIKTPFVYYKLILLINLVFCYSATAEANRPEFHLALKNNLFYPANIVIPSNKKVKLVIHNQDNSVEEFDSFDLNREKVIFPKQIAIIFVGPLPIGEYHFFGEYHPNSARGKVTVIDIEVDAETSSLIVPKELSPKGGSQYVN
jgi:hypothetical protein